MVRTYVERVTPKCRTVPGKPSSLNESVGVQRKLGGSNIHASTHPSLPFVLVCPSRSVRVLIMASMSTQYDVLMPNGDTKFVFPGHDAWHLDFEKIVSVSRQKQGVIILHFPHTFLYHALTVIDPSTQQCTSCKRVFLTAIKRLALKLGESVDNKVQWITYKKWNRMASNYNRYVWNGQETYFPIPNQDIPYDGCSRFSAVHNLQGKYGNFLILNNEDGTLTIPGANNDRKKALKDIKHVKGVIIVTIEQHVIVINPA